MNVRVCVHMWEGVFNSAVHVLAPIPPYQVNSEFMTTAYSVQVQTGGSLHYVHNTEQHSFLMQVIFTVLLPSTSTSHRNPLGYLNG